MEQAKYTAKVYYLSTKGVGKPEIEGALAGMAPREAHTIHMFPAGRRQSAEIPGEGSDPACFLQGNTV
jgi:hypothetical protein